MKLLRARLWMWGMLCVLGAASCQQASQPEMTIKPDAFAVPVPDEPIPKTIAEATQLGTFMGQVLFDGDVPELAPIAVAGRDQDLKLCGITQVPDESWVINPETKGLGNVFVYLAKRPAGMPQRLEKSNESEVNLHQFECRFQPHCLLLRTDQILVAKDDDPMGHHFHHYPNRNPTFSSGISARDKGPRKLQLKISERLPIPVKCDVHPWMKAWWLVLDHPYAAITDQDGKFRIHDLPVGDHEFVIWHEEKGYIAKQFPVKITADKPTDLRLSVNSEKAAPAKP